MFIFFKLSTMTSEILASGNLEKALCTKMSITALYKENFPKMVIKSQRIKTLTVQKEKKNFKYYTLT